MEGRMGLKMKKARLDGLILLLLGGAVVLVLLGFLLVSPTPAAMQDFRVVYYPARCLLQHGDPYRESDVLDTYRAEGGEHPSETAADRQIVIRHIYPPTVFSFSVPFAMLPWGIARVLWMMLTAGSLLFASFLAWNLGADYAPILSGALIGFLLANSEVLIVLGNPSGIVISLCVIAVWCFFRERFVLAGVLGMAIGLLVKPQDAGLVWLCFLLAGGVYRKRALQTLFAAVVLGLPGILLVLRASPHWMQELHANILAFSVHGGITDPGPASTGSNGAGMMINLQTVFSVFRDDPRIYNPATWLLCALPLIVWAFVTLRSRTTPARTWLALAAIAPLSLLPVYHHLYDAKLLLLTVPACAMLWAEGGKLGRFALLANIVAFAFTGDVSWTLLLRLIDGLCPITAGMPGWTSRAMQVFPVPLILLAMSIFYLWVYLSRSREHRTSS
jgi:hypothetical protein